MSERRDIGHGVSIEPHRLRGKIDGVLYWHPCINGGLREGWVPIRPKNPGGWDVVSEDPLTLTPSLRCRACGHHGWIRAGAWVPA